MYSLEYKTIYILNPLYTHQTQTTNIFYKLQLLYTTYLITSYSTNLFLINIKITPQFFYKILLTIKTILYKRQHK